jgi:hypothetical protein
MLVVACRGYPGGSSQRLQGSWNRETEVICRSRKGLGSVVLFVPHVSSTI